MNSKSERGLYCCFSVLIRCCMLVVLRQEMIWSHKLLDDVTATVLLFSQHRKAKISRIFANKQQKHLHGVSCCYYNTSTRRPMKQFPMRGWLPGDRTGDRTEGGFSRFGFISVRGRCWTWKMRTGSTKPKTLTSNKKGCLVPIRMVSPRT